MTFALVIRCDESGCDASAEMEHEEIEPILPSGAEFVLDSGWLELPNGWRFDTAGLRCPKHTPSSAS